MKNSKLLPEITWKQQKLKDIATFINGFAFKPTDWSETGKPIIRIQNLTSDTEPHYFDGNIDSKYHITDGDLILSWSATIDIFIYHGEDAVLNQHLFKVIPNNIDKEFLYYVIKNNIDKLKDLSHGISMKHIKKGDVENCVVSLPESIEDQHKIAKLLSGLDELTKLHISQIDILAKLKSQLMSDVFP